MTGGAFGTFFLDLARTSAFTFAAFVIFAIFLKYERMERWWIQTSSQVASFVFRHARFACLSNTPFATVPQATFFMALHRGTAVTFVLILFVGGATLGLNQPQR